MNPAQQKRASSTSATSVHSPPPVRGTSPMPATMTIMASCSPLMNRILSLPWASLTQAKLTMLANAVDAARIATTRLSIPGETAPSKAILATTAMMVESTTASRKGR